MTPFVAILAGAILAIVLRHWVISEWKAGRFSTDWAALLVALPLPTIPVIAYVLGANLSPQFVLIVMLLLLIPGYLVARTMLNRGFVKR